MSRWTAFLIAGAVSLSALGAGPADAEPRYRVEVNGLTCPFCAYAIEKSLRALPGVTELTTHVARGVVEIEVAEGATLSREDVAAAVERAGFELAGFSEVDDATGGEDP